MDTIRDTLIQLLLDHWHLIALAVAGVSALGTLLGLVKKLAATIFAKSLQLGEAGTAAVMSKKGLRVCVPLALAGTLFGSGWLLGASKPPKVEYVTQPPEIITRDVVKEVEVIKEVKVPTIVEKIVEIPAKIFTPAANAKCYWCAALLNLDNLPRSSIRDGREPGIVRCGGCYGLVMPDKARQRYRFERDEPMWTGRVDTSDNLSTYTASPVGRDSIPKPVPPGPDASEDDRKKYPAMLEEWKRKCER